MIPFAPLAIGEIRALLQSCTDANFDSTFSQLCKFAEYGVDACILLLQACLEQLNINDAGAQRMKEQPDILIAIVRFLLDRPNSNTIFCEALNVVATTKGFLENLSNVLNLSLPMKVGIGLALSESEHPDIKSKGQNFCISQIEELCASGNTELSNLQIQDIVMFLYHSEGLSKHVDSFTRMLSLIPLKESSLMMLMPMLPELPAVNSLRKLESVFESPDNDFETLLEEIEKEMNMAEVIKELGYGCTLSTSNCKEILSLFQPLNETTIAKLLGTIARTYTGLEDVQNIHSTFCSVVLGSSPGDLSLPDSWNVDVLVESIEQLAPKTNWVAVIENLDHEGFFVPDDNAFKILMSIYHKACQDPFPIHAVCGSIWRNAEGQLSFLRHAAFAPSNLFTFAHSTRQLTFLGSSNLSIGNGNNAWFSLDFLEVLCKLAEMGHAASVRLLLEYPLNHCPEALLVGISQIHTAYDLMQYEVSSTVFPTIFRDHAKRSVIDNLWNLNPCLVLREFLILHYSDPNNISHILEICQELEILFSVLDMAPPSFSIRLAAVASQKELINLEKWLNENLRNYKDAFLEDCLLFLNEVLPDVHDASNGSLGQPLARLNVNQDTLATFLKVLQAQSGQFASHQIFEEVKRLHASLNSQDLGGLATELATAEGKEAVETEANAYFHRMFSEQITVNEIVQMLIRFKESSEKREKLLFDCIIANMFDEYKFFPKYPERQLKITADLFGAIIKHQLVTHLSLGIALRTVLDALRKSVDSKMFTFGVRALEQFQERLKEWPQYCNHLLQISHLRSANPDLVSVIEQALSPVSSRPSESNGGNTLSADQQQGPAQFSVENMETGQHGSPLQSQRSQGTLDDRLKVTGASASNLKPAMSSFGQPSLVSMPVDSTSSQKASLLHSVQTQTSQHAANGSIAVTSSPGFLRPSRSIASAGMLRQTSYGTGFGAALNIETLVAAAERRDAPVEAPAPEIQDKILFMINNISTTNMDVKAKEFTEVLKEQYYPWFAQYMVMKRASIEPNFHDLYLKFLEKVNSKLLNKEIVKATYENCKVLLRSELIKSSSEERSLLKNLGSWLGKFTIGRNQVLLAKEIDPKSLIIEAYEKGLMIAVIPFTSKILEPCQSSAAYQPPNPWTMAILSLLVEIYNLPNLKMNLKFDIEVLFKNLGVDMKDVKPTSLLKDRTREVEGNPDFSSKDISSSQPTLVAEMNSGLIPTLSHVDDTSSSAYQSGHPSAISQLPQFSTPLHLASSTILEEDKAGSLIIPERLGSGQASTQAAQLPTPFSAEQLAPLVINYESYVNVNPRLSSTGIPFHRYIVIAMDKAIKDILSPVIQRSVTIASRTTKEIVLKDFAMESDGNAVSTAARMMVFKLAGSLAHVTCKEPLRGALSTSLRSVLQNNCPGADIDQIVQSITSDNLDLGCAVIESVATAKAMELIDGEIGPAFAQRKQREAAGSAFLDATYGPNARIPESLRPKPGHLSFAQQQVYKDFVRNTSNQSNQGSNVPRSSAPGIGASSINSSISRAYASSTVQLNSSLYSNQQMGSSFNSATQPFDLSPEESDRGSAMQISIPSSQSGGGDDNSAQQSPKGGALMNSLQATAVTVPDLHVLDASSVSKEMGAAVPLSPSPPIERLGEVVPESLLTTREALDKYQLVAQRLADLVSKDAREVEIQGVVSEVPDIILKCVTRDEAALAVAQKVFKSLYESASNCHIACQLAVLAAIRDVCKLVVKELTSWVIYSDEERKFNKEITIGLIRSELLNLAEYNVHLAKLIDGGRNKAATEFAISLMQALVVQEPGVSMSEFYNLIEALEKLSMRPGSPESLHLLLEIVRSTSANSNSLSGLNSNKEEKVRQLREKKTIAGRSLTGREESSLRDSATPEPPGIREQVSLLYSDWCRILDHPATADPAYAPYVQQLQQNGWLKGDDVTEHFFRMLTELSVSNCLVSEQSPMSVEIYTSQQQQQISFVSIDSYAKLVISVLKYYSLDQGSSKANLLAKILSVTAKVIMKDADEKKTMFNPRPYFRLFVYWLSDLASLDHVLDGNNFQILAAFANVFHALQPLRVPGWSFAWLELVSHRSFMPKLLTLNAPNGWPLFQRLLVDLFKFMEPYLRNAELGDSVRFLYKGSLRVLLVLLHDFPEFLCDYHFSFCDVIPPSCIQMRNVILSAFPRNMRLPDPSTPNLKIDLLPEIRQSPRILSDVDGALKARQLRADIDEYLKTKPEGSPFLTELKQKLLLPPSEALQAGTRYNVPLINSIVLYVGMQAIQHLQSKSASGQPLAHSPPSDSLLVNAAMDIFQSLIRNLDTEGRYLFLNAVANQLRYPNNHTHYFSFVLLYLFSEANQEIIQEQITRVLLERLIVNRPHPWGLLITFIELIKNSRYNFWNRSFTHCAPEIEKLFESVARSCGGPRAVDDMGTDGSH